MPRRSLWTDEDGSAAIEFIALGVVLLTPIVYLIVALGTVQSHALGVEAAARHLARTIATSPDSATADARAATVLSAVAREYGLDTALTDVGIGCRPESGACPAAGATIVVTVTSTAQLPFVPPILGLDEIARVPVEATGIQKVSRFWTGG